MEEIVTNVGRSPWLWGHAVSFDLEASPVPGVLQDPTHRDRPVRLGGGPGHDLPRPRRSERSGVRLRRSGILEDTVEAVDGRVLVQRTHTRRAESVFSFGPDYSRVRHDPDHGIALSIHAYTPATLDYSTTRSRRRERFAWLISGRGAGLRVKSLCPDGFVDLSAPIRPDPPDYPEPLRTDIEFADHAEGAATIEQLFGVGAELLRDGEGWATETFLRFGTHNSTHVDAPWHYNFDDRRPALANDR